MHEMKSLVRLFALIMLVLAAAQARAADAARFFDATVGDYRQELQDARKQGKRGVLLMFEMDDCPYCKRMRETVLNKPEVQEYFHRHFLVFTVDALGNQPIQDFAGRDTREKDFAREFRVRATPTFVFVDLDGRRVASYEGATRDEREFMTLGRYVAEGHYRTGSFEKYRAAPGS